MDRREKKEEFKESVRNNLKVKNNLENKIGGMEIKLINVDGLTNAKYGELMNLCFQGKRKLNILCMTETHENWGKFLIDKNLDSFDTRREIRDKKNGIKKGGGLKILIEKSKQIKFKKVDRKSKEILEIVGVCFGMELKIILVYLDVDKGELGKLNNGKIKKEIEESIKNQNKGGLMILGDFNGHSELLEPNRKEDLNGKMIKEWIENFDLILLNADCKCEGIYTRCRGEQKSAIDMVMVNEEMYRICNKMEIDEGKEIISFSDHNLINIDLKLGGGNKNGFKSGKWVIDEYHKIDNTTIDNYTVDMQNKWVRERESIYHE
ncbi:unnamed protein product [Meganyctiphanes norvegica]|uniref:Endonuclease/exonuclease/phosphatase domain-containing protein n=1 Tax=Meganyctiphanes norvegica TaxID=48144 RepID=A0AAV2S2L3_MEGNR